MRHNRIPARRKEKARELAQPEQAKQSMTPVTKPQPQPQPSVKPSAPTPAPAVLPTSPAAATPPPTPPAPKSPSLLDMVAKGNLPEWWIDNPPLVVFSGARWVATGGGQRPVQLARQWAEGGRQVLFISNRGQQFGIHEGVICGNFADHLPLWLPLLSRCQGGTMFCGMPAYHSHLGGRMNHWRMVLDICDDWEEFVRIGALERDNWEPEAVANAFAHADLVTYSASCLETFCKRYGARRTLLVPNGGPEAPVARQTLKDMALGNGLNVAFCSALWGRWVDWETLRQMARDLADADPEAVVHVIGGMDNAGNPPERPLEPNMRCYGERIWSVALQMMANCDVAVIPFRNRTLCKAVDPNKWYDYIAAGLPVVATDVMEELRGRPYTLVCKPEDMAQAVLLSAQQGRIPEAEIKRLAGETSWRVRADAIMRGLAAVPNTRLVRRAWRDVPREAAS